MFVGTRVSYAHIDPVASIGRTDAAESDSAVVESRRPLSKNGEIGRLSG